LGRRQHRPLVLHQRQRLERGAPSGYVLTPFSSLRRRICRPDVISGGEMSRVVWACGMCGEHSDFWIRLSKSGKELAMLGIALQPCRSLRVSSCFNKVLFQSTSSRIVCSICSMCLLQSPATLVMHHYRKFGPTQLITLLFDLTYLP
jgi:hypothetical protein